jgi:flagellin
MIGINSNINSLVAQQNLNTSQSALSQAITRLSSGKRINSAADDAAGLAISNRMQTQINGLNAGVSNANNGVSMIQTASSGLAQITSSLQTIRTLAVQASSGSLSASDQAALQQEVAQQIAEVNRVASQTTYNGKNVLDGSAGNVSFQIGANVGQTIGLNLAQGVSAASLGQGLVSTGSTLGTMANVSIDSATGGAYNASSSSGYQITSINVLSDGQGGFSYTDQNNQALSKTATAALFGSSTGVGGALNITAANSSSALLSTSQLSAISTANNTPPAGTGTAVGTISGISISATTGQDVAAGTQGAITSITVKTNGTGGLNFYDQTGAQLAAGLVGDDSGTNPGSLLTITKGAGSNGDSVSFTNDVATQAAKISGGPLAATTAGVITAGVVGMTGTAVGPATPTQLGTAITGLSINSSGQGVTAGTAGAITSISVFENTNGSLTFKDQNNKDITSSAAVANLFTATNGNGTTTAPTVTVNATAAANVPAKTTTITGLSIDASTGKDVPPGTQGAITSITVTQAAGGTLSFTDQSGAAVGAALVGTTAAPGSLIKQTAGTAGNGNTFAFTAGATPISYSAPQNSAFAGIDSNNNPGTVANVNVSTTAGANAAMESIDNALATVNNIQATLGAAQNRFTSLASAQQSQSTDLAGAQSQITDADFAQETANLSRAQVLQQAGISVLAQANSNPQQVLKLLQ